MLAAPRRGRPRLCGRMLFRLRLGRLGRRERERRGAIRALRCGPRSDSLGSQRGLFRGLAAALGWPQRRAGPHRVVRRVRGGSSRFGRERRGPWCAVAGRWIAAAEFRRGRLRPLRPLVGLGRARLWPRLLRRAWQRRVRRVRRARPVGARVRGLFRLLGAGAPCVGAGVGPAPCGSCCIPLRLGRCAAGGLAIRALFAQKSCTLGRGARYCRGAVAARL